MHHYKWPLRGVFFLIMVLMLQSIPAFQAFVEAVQSGSTRTGWEDPANSAAVSLTEDKEDQRQKLLDTIQAEAAKRNIPPINAKVDPVWKAIPAYNGLEVDVEQTLKLAEHGITPGSIQYVMKETSPSIQLDDLGPYPIYKGNPNKPMASLMINVAWGNEYLPSMLEILRKHGVHATFFLDGSWLKKNVEMAKLIQSEGHELSNHAYSHKDMRTISREKAIEEISKTEELLEQLGVSNTLFAPPSGSYSQETVRIASEMKLKTILWTFDTIDWKNPGPDRILERLSQNIEPGSLILMHPTASSSQALDGMIRIIKNKGLTLGTVSELLSPKRVPEAKAQS